MKRSEVERYLHRAIPLSHLMGVEVVSVSDEGVTLGAPLQPNINHRGTVFGGSASAVAILAGWTYVFCRLRREPISTTIVIQRNTMHYERPITGDLTAVCYPPPSPSWEAFSRALKRHGKGRITLNAEVFNEGTPVAEFRGAYVGIKVEGGSLIDGPNHR